MTVLLSVEHVGVRFGGLVAIADLHFDVHQGEVVSLIGPNGAGKTTAFNVITGFLRPSTGDVCFRGTSFRGLQPHSIARLGLARTFQRTSVFPDDTVLANIMIALHQQSIRLGRARRTAGTVLDIVLGRRGTHDQVLRERAEALLERVGLSSWTHDQAGALAYGVQRLVGVALALATEPAMLLLDEPVSGMNASETRVFISLIQRVQASGVSILLVEHDMPMVMEVSDRIVVLNHGRLIADGPPERIRQDRAVIEAYLGQGAAARRKAQDAANGHDAAHA